MFSKVSYSFSNSWQISHMHAHTTLKAVLVDPLRKSSLRWTSALPCFILNKKGYKSLSMLPGDLVGWELLKFTQFMLFRLQSPRHLTTKWWWRGGVGSPTMAVTFSTINKPESYTGCYESTRGQEQSRGLLWAHGSYGERTLLEKKDQIKDVQQSSTQLTAIKSILICYRYSIFWCPKIICQVRLSLLKTAHLETDA